MDKALIPVKETEEDILEKESIVSH
jgi:hypothetical protein